MTQRISLLLAATALLAAAANLSADEKKYLLSKTPVFQVGDVAVAKGTETLSQSVTLKTKEVVKAGEVNKRDHCVCEVLEVDKAGKIQAFRVTIVSAEAKHETAAPTKELKAISLAKVHFTAKRDGMTFKPDTTTVVSEKHEKLTASQIYRLKDICKDDITFPAHPEPDVLLMPSEPVPVGHTWQPSAKTLKRWIKESGGAPLPAEVVHAKFTLVSVTNGVALVQGDLRARFGAGPEAVEAPAQLTCKIDTRSGRWNGTSMKVDFDHSIGGVTVKVKARSPSTVTFTRGKGKASALPKKVHKLGWKPPGKDTNGQIHKPLGLSLNIPEGYIIQTPPKQGDVVLVYVKPKLGANIRVTTSDLAVPGDLADFIRVFEASVKGSIEIVSKERLSLPGNVPAVLIAGKMQAGQTEVALLTVMATDGQRLVSVTGARQSKDKESLAELRAAVKSLRLFEKTAPKPKEKDKEKD